MVFDKRDFWEHFQNFKKRPWILWKMNPGPAYGSWFISWTRILNHELWSRIFYNESNGDQQAPKLLYCKQPGTFFNDLNIRNFSIIQGHTEQKSKDLGNTFECFCQSRIIHFDNFMCLWLKHTGPYSLHADKSAFTTTVNWNL